MVINSKTTIKAILELENNVILQQESEFVRGYKNALIDLKKKLNLLINCKEGNHRFKEINCKCGHKHCMRCGVCQCLNSGCYKRVKNAI